MRPELAIPVYRTPTYLNLASKQVAGRASTAGTNASSLPMNESSLFMRHSKVGKEMPAELTVPTKKKQTTSKGEG